MLGKHSKVNVEINIPPALTGGNYFDKLKLDDVASGNIKLPRAVRARREAGIAGYVGFNGSAKTASMVRDTLPDLLMGRPVLGTVAFYDWTKRADNPDHALNAWGEKGALEVRPADELILPHPLWIPLKDWTQVPDFRDGVLALDEITGVADAREAGNIPVQISDKFFQMRRADVTVRWTTIDWSAADKRMRRATSVVSLCKGYFPRTVPGRVWKQKTVFRIRTYQARGFDDFTTAINRVSDKQRPQPIASEWVRLHGGLSEAITAYGSEASVLTVGAASEAGMCMDCGGKRSMPRCKC